MIQQSKLKFFKKMSAEKKNNYTLPYIIFLGIFLVTVLAITNFNVLRTVNVSRLGEELNTDEFYALGHEANVEILDIRAPEQYNFGHIGGVTFIDFNDSLNFKSNIDKLNRNKTYMIYCKTDQQSAYIMKLMREMGFTDIHFLKGGIHAWKLAGRPVIKEVVNK